MRLKLQFLAFLVKIKKIVPVLHNSFVEFSEFFKSVESFWWRYYIFVCKNAGTSLNCRLLHFDTNERWRWLLAYLIACNMVHTVSKNYHFFFIDDSFLTFKQICHNSNLIFFFFQINLLRLFKMISTQIASIGSHAFTHTQKFHFKSQTNAFAKHNPLNEKFIHKLNFRAYFVHCIPRWWLV